MPKIQGRFRIRKMRLKEGLTLAEFIDEHKLKCWPSFLSRVENGERGVSVKRAIQWETKLGLPGLARELVPQLRKLQ